MKMRIEEGCVVLFPIESLQTLNVWLYCSPDRPRELRVSFVAKGIEGRWRIALEKDPILGTCACLSRGAMPWLLQCGFVEDEEITLEEEKKGEWAYDEKRHT